MTQGFCKPQVKTAMTTAYQSLFAMVNIFKTTQALFHNHLLHKRINSLNDSEKRLIVLRGVNLNYSWPLLTTDCQSCYANPPAIPNHE